MFARDREGWRRDRWRRLATGGASLDAGGNCGIDARAESLSRIARISVRRRCGRSAAVDLAARARPRLSFTQGAEPAGHPEAPFQGGLSMPWNQLGDGSLNVLSDEKIANGIFGKPGLIPRFFMTGDGHQEPPFQWSGKCAVMKQYFETAMQNGQLCAHVERLQSDVAAGNVPAFLQPLYQQNRIFGWELPIFAPLARCGQLYYGIGPALANNQIDRALLQTFSEFSHFAQLAHQLVASVGSPAELTDVLPLLNGLAEYIVAVIAKQQPAKAETSGEYRTRLKTYYDAIMELRTTAHRFIATPIQSVINEYPQCIHIITCGNAHITVNNPLHQYLHIGDAIGVVDAARVF